ncbi:AAA-domain-containing protein [Imleria badia]|nr:AAA-domain-containing protein [Imleria badia]
MFFLTLYSVLDKKTEKHRSQILAKLGKKGLKLDEYELSITKEVVCPDDIQVRFEDIGGLDPIIASLRESVIYPLMYPHLFTASSSLLSAPKGVLLYGPPGCGKTMLARALAKESGATFINIPASVLTNKWFGESNKLVAGLFSLARKMQPTIIFVDEIDTFLRERRTDDHEVMSMIKAEFMTSWDGLTSGEERIMVLGATNRPMDIDPAILRRMPKRFAVALPNAEQRLKILSLMLNDTKLDPSLTLDMLAAKTTGFSGSDLRELCRNAAMVPVRECMREMAHDEEAIKRVGEDGFTMRPLTLHDFYDAEGSTLTLTDPDPEDEPLPLDGYGSTLAEEKQVVEVKEDATNSIDDGATLDVSNDEGVDFEGR